MKNKTYRILKKIKEYEEDFEESYLVSEIIETNIICENFICEFQIESDAIDYVNFKNKSKIILSKILIEEMLVDISLLDEDDIKKSVQSLILKDLKELLRLCKCEYKIDTLKEEMQKMVLIERIRIEAIIKGLKSLETHPADLDLMITIIEFFEEKLNER